MVVKKIINISEELAEKIAEFRFSNRIKSEAEAMRQLWEAGLRAMKKDKK